MKNIFVWFLIACITFIWVNAYTQHNIESANFLAWKWVINNNLNNPVAYNLDFNITRREMLKVMMNISWKTVIDSCEGRFTDLSSSDWGCKYAEAALAAWFIAQNNSFRPNDNVTQIEALKMIMQAKWIERNDASDWRAGYVSKAYSEWLLKESRITYDLFAVRWWIFSTGARSYSEFTYESPETNLTPEEEELFNSLLDL